VVELIDGGATETRMIDKDGQFGGGPALDHKISLNFVVMQGQPRLLSFTTCASPRSTHHPHPILTGIAEAQ
jgi:hypothetical protein